MRVLPSAALAATVLLATIAAAEWNENGRLAEEAAWRKNEGEFGAMLLVTDKLEAFLEAWEVPSSPGYHPNISTTDRAKRGDTVAAVILFTACAANEAGKCRSIVDFRVLRPDGSIYASHERAPLWDLSPPPKHNLQLGIAQLVFEVEPDDPLGEYRIEARVRDLVALRVVELERAVRVGE